ncbi:hypothetical protein Dimus_031925, partial [Dionaea muscipula]
PRLPSNTQPRTCTTTHACYPSPPITQPKLPPAEDFTDHHRDHQRGRAATSAASPSPRSSNLLTFKPHRRLSHHHLRRPTPTTDHRREVTGFGEFGEFAQGNLQMCVPVEVTDGDDSSKNRARWWASKMYFRGQRIWSAAMEELMAKGMRHASKSDDGSAILGMHSIVSRPMVVGGQVVPRPMMYIALTYDHRLIDGREAVFFLRRIKDVVEDPRRLLLNV